MAFSTLVYAAIFCGMSGMATGTAAAFFRYWFILLELTLAITFFGMFLASASLIPQVQSRPSLPKLSCSLPYIPNWSLQNGRQGLFFPHD